MASRSDVVFLFALVAAVGAHKRHHSVRSKPLEEVDRTAVWRVSGDKGKDIVHKSLVLEGRRQRFPARRLQDSLPPGCSSDAESVCSGFSLEQQIKIRASLIQACSNTLPSSEMSTQSCCNSVQGKGEFYNNTACLCGDKGGLRAFIPEHFVERLLKTCHPDAASQPAANHASPYGQPPPPLNSEQTGAPRQQASFPSNIDGWPGMPINSAPQSPPPPDHGSQPQNTMPALPPPPSPSLEGTLPVLPTFPTTPSIDFTASNIANSLGIGNAPTPPGK